MKVITQSDPRKKITDKTSLNKNEQKIDRGKGNGEKIERGLKTNTPLSPPRREFR